MVVGNSVLVPSFRVVRGSSSLPFLGWAECVPERGAWSRVFRRLTLRSATGTAQRAIPTTRGKQSATAQVRLGSNDVRLVGRVHLVCPFFFIFINALTLRAVAKTRT